MGKDFKFVVKNGNEILGYFKELEHAARFQETGGWSVESLRPYERIFIYTITRLGE